MEHIMKRLFGFIAAAFVLASAFTLYFSNTVTTVTPIDNRHSPICSVAYDKRSIAMTTYNFVRQTVRPLSSTVY